MGLMELFSRAAARVLFHLDTSSDLPSAKVCDALTREGWTFETSEDGNGTVISNIKLFDPAARGYKPLVVIPTETPFLTIRTGNQEIINAYESTKKRIAAEIYGF